MNSAHAIAQKPKQIADDSWHNLKCVAKCVAKITKKKNKITFLLKLNQIESNENGILFQFVQINKKINSYVDCTHHLFITKHLCIRPWSTQK